MRRTPDPSESPQQATDRRRAAAMLKIRSHLMPVGADEMCQERLTWRSRLEEYQKPFITKAQRIAAMASHRRKGPPGE